MENKKQLLQNLKYDTYVRLQASKIHGIGVFAIKDIPKGTNPFMVTNKQGIKYNNIDFSESEIKKLPEEIQEYLKALFFPDGNNIYSIPYNGLNSLDISFYLNHSKNNNLNIVPNNTDFLEFITNKNIKKGDELTIDYNHYKKFD